MASTMSIGSTKAEESIMKGVRRSRLSFHFNALRRRCWLMVQLVSVPSETVEPESDTQRARTHRIETSRPCGLAEHLDKFQATQMLRQRI